jgi:hypothetical protein
VLQAVGSNPAIHYDDIETSGVSGAFQTTNEWMTDHADFHEWIGLI